MNIFIHGLMGSPSNWNQVVSHLWNDPLAFKSLTIDYMNSLDRNISYVTKEVENSKYNIGIGNSIGCLLLLKVADKFDRLILVAPPYKFLNKSAFATTAKMDELKKELFYDYKKVDSKEIDKAINKWKNKTRDKKTLQRLKEIKKELLEFNFVECYKKNQNKIHFVLGSHDILVPIQEFQDKALKFYPKARITVLPKCSHILQMEKPYELSRIIRQENRDINAYS